jgi:large subunit ribosomal protein L35
MTVTRYDEPARQTAIVSEEAMPKNKTHSGTKKRVKVTGSGKLTHAGSGKRHHLENKPSSHTRRLAGAQQIAKVDAPRIRRLLGI